METGEAELDEDNLLHVEDMISVCSGLVTIDEEKRNHPVGTLYDAGLLRASAERLVSIRGV